MPDVYFITNRALAGPADQVSSYTAQVDTRLSTGVAEVGEADCGALRCGPIARIRDTAPDQFDPAVETALGRSNNLLLFIHGYANSFEDAVTRGAFNRDWLAASGVPEADCTVLAFTWPSPGVAVTLEDLLGTLATLLLIPLASLIEGRLTTPATGAYLADQKRAMASGDGLVSAFDRVRPVLEAVRRRGGRTYLLVHSMGHHLLAHAVMRPQVQAIQSVIFDEAFLVAGDTTAAATASPLDWIPALQQLAGRVHLYTSEGDDILRLSQLVNGQGRLGQRGESGLPDDALRLLDCTGTKLLDTSGEGRSGHSYYRRDVSVRDDMAHAMAGDGKPGRWVLPEQGLGAARG